MNFSLASRNRSDGKDGRRRIRWLIAGVFVCCLALSGAFFASNPPARAVAAKKSGDKGKENTGGSKGKEKDGKPAPPRYGATPPRLDAKAWVLIDARDGEVLAAKAADSERMIASTTKMMTAYVAHQLLDPGKVVRAPRYRASPGESLAGLEGGDRISIRDLLYALLLPSGNDAAEALSKVAESNEKRFVAEMNAAARRLGLAHTHYSTPVGLDERGNYSSARDLAELARVLLADPLLSRIVDTEERTIKAGGRKIPLVNHNNLVLTKPWVSGVKTGYTSSAGYSLVGAGTRDNTTLISVVLGSPSEAVRDQASLDLLGWGFSRYQKSVPVREGEQIVSSGLDYRDTRVPLLSAETLPVLVRDGQEVRVDTDAPDELVGPVADGERVGRVTVLVGGEPAVSAPLVTGAAAPAATLGEKAKALVLSPLILIPIGLVLLLVGFVLIFRSRAEKGDNATQRA